MRSLDKFWSGEKKQAAERCEDKNCRLFYDELQECYFVIKKNPDGSILHTKETELFKSRSIQEVNDFIKSYSRKPVYENIMCKAVDMKATCNACDRIIFEGDKYMEGGYCEECAEGIERADGKPLEEIKTIT